jgi:hypothetical protein
MDSSSRGRGAFLTVAGVLVALGVVAIASRGSTGTGGGGARRPTDTLLDIMLSLYIVVLVAAALFVLYLIALRRTVMKEQQGRARRDIRSALGVLLFVGALTLLARDLQGRRLETVPEVPQIAPSATDTAAADGTREPYVAEFAWLPVLVILGLVALVVGGLWWSGRSRRRARGEHGHDPFADAFATAVDVSLDDLRAEPDPRRAVIAAYARLEQVLAAHGLPRHEAEAPLEYLSRMLARLEVSPEAARRLTDLFERAKFSHHETGPEMKLEAIAALETVRDDLAAARARAEDARQEALTAMRERIVGS